MVSAKQTPPSLSHRTGIGPVGQFEIGVERRQRRILDLGCCVRVRRPVEPGCGFRRGNRVRIRGGARGSPRPALFVPTPSRRQPSGELAPKQAPGATEQ